MNYSLFKEKMYQVNLISAMNSLLSWDMEVNMPTQSDKGFRADQMAFVSGLHFQKATDRELVDLINLLSQSNELSDMEMKNVKVAKKDMDNMLKFTQDFVEKEAKLTSEAHNIWVEARKKSDFKIFEKSLESIVTLLREKCEILGYENHPYNALLNQYEEGSNVVDLDKLFADVKVRLKPLIEAVKSKQTSATQFLNQKFDGTKQMELVADILNHLKFDANLYKINLSTHPFCTHFHPTDIRITTRINENDLMSSIWSGIHEMGHGMYEMGLNKENVIM
jgi:carboxypeptidase Taq